MPVPRKVALLSTPFSPGTIFIGLRNRMFILEAPRFINNAGSLPSIGLFHLPEHICDQGLPAPT
jgi:hypothetical protein